MYIIPIFFNSDQILNKVYFKLLGLNNVYIGGLTLIALADVISFIPQLVGTNDSNVASFGREKFDEAKAIYIKKGLKPNDNRILDFLEVVNRIDQGHQAMLLRIATHIAGIFKSFFLVIGLCMVGLLLCYVGNICLEILNAAMELGAKESIIKTIKVCTIFLIIPHIFLLYNIYCHIFRLFFRKLHT